MKAETQKTCENYIYKLKSQAKFLSLLTDSSLSVMMPNGDRCPVPGWWTWPNTSGHSVSASLHITEDQLQPDLGTGRVVVTEGATHLHDFSLNSFALRAVVPFLHLFSLLSDENKLSSKISPAFQELL